MRTNRTVFKEIPFLRAKCWKNHYGMCAGAPIKSRSLARTLSLYARRNGNMLNSSCRLVAFFVVLSPWASASESASGPGPTPHEKLLFDFENPGDLAVWSNRDLPDGKRNEPPATVELATTNATSGKHSLKITFAGGRWPTITTTAVPSDWMTFQTFKADVTVSRHCL